MSILTKLATSLDRKDELPNQALAKQIVKDKDKTAVQELIEHLSSRQKGIPNDCIKVLYEIGQEDPVLISGHSSDFLALLKSKNNRLQWGAMAALNHITSEIPGVMFSSLTLIIDAMESGSVITKDNGINILIKLCMLKEYQVSAFPLLIEQLLACPTNQLPMYAERAIPIINEDNKLLFIKTLESRLDDIDKDSKRKRVAKVIRKFSSK